VRLFLPVMLEDGAAARLANDMNRFETTARACVYGLGGWCLAEGQGSSDLRLCHSTFLPSVMCQSPWLLVNLFMDKYVRMQLAKKQFQLEAPSGWAKVQAALAAAGTKDDGENPSDDEDADEDVSNDREACPICGQDCYETACKHWVLSLGDDSDNFDEEIPLAFDWCGDARWTQLHERLRQSLVEFWITFQSFVEKRMGDPPSTIRKLNRSLQKLPRRDVRLVTATVRAAVADRADHDELADLIRESGSGPLKAWFTDLHKQVAGKSSDNATSSGPGYTWTGTEYFSQDAPGCLKALIHEVRSATDRFRAHQS
jgi:hypothetical protein